MFCSELQNGGWSQLHEWVSMLIGAVPATPAKMIEKEKKEQKDGRTSKINIACQLIGRVLTLCHTLLWSSVQITDEPNNNAIVTEYH